MGLSVIICHSYDPSADDTRTDNPPKFCNLGEGVWLGGFFEDLKQAIDRMNEIIRDQVQMCIRFHEDVKTEKDIFHDRGDYYWSIATPANYRLAVQIQLLDENSRIIQDFVNSKSKKAKGGTE